MPEVKVVRAPELGSGIESVEAAVREFKRQEADVIVLEMCIRDRFSDGYTPDADGESGQTDRCL